MKTAGKVLLGVIGVLLVICGIMCFAAPMTALSSVSKIIGTILILSGAATALFFFMTGKFLIFSWGLLVNAAADIFAGILFCCYSDSAAKVFAVLFSLLLIFGGLFITPISFLVKGLTKNTALWLVVMATGIVTLILGILGISNPGTYGVSLITIPIGLLLLLIGAVYLVITFLLFKNGDDNKFIKS